MDDEVRRTTIAEELAQGKTVIYFTVGVSMQPLLFERRTHVTIAPLKGGARNNDILLYLRKNGAQVLHRLIKQDEAFFYMRGDNTYGLERIAKSQAIGVVTSIYRNGKQIDTERNWRYKGYVLLWRVNYPLRCLSRKGETYLRRVRKIAARMWKKK